MLGRHACLVARCVGVRRSLRTSAARRAKPTRAPARRGGDAALAAALAAWEPVIGVEVHAQLTRARTKAYCACAPARSAGARAAPPNTRVCRVCVGEPGALPAPSAEVVRLSATAALALGCAIAPRVAYDRKNYFYADTPKNYQITQEREPLGVGGSLELPGARKAVRIERVHMEEDSAKMTHVAAGAGGGAAPHALVDFNRAGVALVEIVSAPDLRSGAEVAEYGRELQLVLRDAAVSDGAMADGSLRMDVNVSLRPRAPSPAAAGASPPAFDAEPLRAKVEIKNVNSFRSAAAAVDYEVVRQAAAYDAGRGVAPATVAWDERAGRTRLLRVKGGASDYRFFPEVSDARAPRARARARSGPRKPF